MHQDNFKDTLNDLRTPHTILIETINRNITTWEIFITLNITFNLNIIALDAAIKDYLYKIWKLNYRDQLKTFLSP